MATLPLPELELLKRWDNHAKLARNLQDLGLVSDLSLLRDYVHEVASAWFLLGREHLTECQVSISGGASRAGYSRAYYGAYNISKAVRFTVAGWVSLKGDDHKAVGSLPKDFDNSAHWGSVLDMLYQHRLRADYDNWSNTSPSYTMTPKECLEQANDFHDLAAQYLDQKMGLKV